MLKRKETNNNECLYNEFNAFALKTFYLLAGGFVKGLLPITATAAAC